MQVVLNQFKEQIQSAITTQKKINICGGNTKNWYGDPPNGEVLNTLQYSGILDYQPEELVITACAGTPLKEVEAALIAKNQYFAFEPPHYGENATIGGMVAAGLAGPGRGQFGGLRDYVLGTKMMDGNGQILSFGGKVMKNVAGYDVSRLMPGSLGTLGLILEMSIKVLPLPARTETLKFQIPASQAIVQMNSWASQPLPLSASTWLGNSQSGELWIRLAGANAAVVSAIQKMQQLLPSEIIDAQQANVFWESIREQTHSFFTNSNDNLWRFAVNPLSEPFATDHVTMMEWFGGQRWIKGNLSREEAQNLAAQNQGYATLYRNHNHDSGSVFTPITANPLTAPLAIVQKRVQNAFDPHGIFQTGRMPY
ncbi:glycolate oxidase subunit GlcE [Polynucleobacter sp. SHI8]|uniref:glycolate oxidase subunit GlcE n=1 Tax=unclassified Polynucleobacter TaxID=2640945 RepID=UPI0024929AF1|nr:MULTISPECIES: glycolate oxidase subunit GlcE [unclassified Polynucleobacter]BDW11966.1 glycolate oxidase subunit GlcE [Polynucleobacter sp. SHI2]BDW14413.1 glycolate oxidase subunit GlcE [Polynucleobacter sp. SHI8]